MFLDLGKLCSRNRKIYNSGELGDNFWNDILA